MEIFSPISATAMLKGEDKKRSDDGMMGGNNMMGGMGGDQAFFHFNFKKSTIKTTKHIPSACLVEAFESLSL